MAKANYEKENPSLEVKIFAILSYLSILCIIPLLLKNDHPFVLSHGKQGLIIFVGEAAVFIVSIIFPWIFKIGMFILFGLSFVGIIAALKGRTIDLPWVSDIARKL